MYALTATIGYEDCICSFDCGFETFGRNWLEISGTDGAINVNQFTNGGGFTGGNHFTIARAGEKEPERVEIEQELSNQARMVEAFSSIVLGARWTTDLTRFIFCRLRCAAALLWTCLSDTSVAVGPAWLQRARWTITGR